MRRRRTSDHALVKEAFKRLLARREILPSDSELSIKLDLRRKKAAPVKERLSQCHAAS